ncbi:MAG TPA: alpha/beta hydrolase [Pseudonocardiaceae bacterium]|jgi:pimeloyl-ACP methyl ester carboxylesterase|nr:alpha/beta hydrolase [Pseudonocardiaceae bacterium]
MTGPARRRVALIGAAALLVTGCGTVISGTPVAEGYVPPGLERFYDQTPNWGPCEPYATDDESRQVYDRTDIRCARLTVPMDYSKPDGAVITLGLLKVGALDPDRRIGSLIMNPGGPGESGMLEAVDIGNQIADTDLAARFDLIGFDPRGVGASQPEVHCLTDAEQDAQRLEVPLDDDQKEADREQVENQQYAQDCAKRTGDAMLANVGTRDVAKDLDVLRAALGDSQLTYLGFSYGTAIGTQYAVDFPKNVRAMILDGAVDPDQSDTDAGLAQNSGFDDAFDAFATWCAKQKTCGIGTDPTNDQDALDKLTEPLKTTPVAVGGRKLSYQDVQTAVSAALYSEDDWPTLNQGLIELGQGKGDTLLQLADGYLGRDPDGQYSNSNDVFNAVHCADYPPVKDRQVLVQQDHAYDKSIGEDPAQDTYVPPLGICAYWPVPNTSQPYVPNAPGLPQVLVISTTHDPATPYQQGVNLAKDLNARLLTFDGTQHTAFLSGSDCIDKWGINYLVDLTLPPAGTTCSS